MSEFSTPILLIAFNRIHTLEKVFQRIKQVEPTRLYIAVDGPRASKMPEEAHLVEEVIAYLKGAVTWRCKTEFLIRKENLGCKLGVSSAITWFFENVEAGIILEDDCVPETSFFKYCSELLDQYKGNNEVMMISGDQFASLDRLHDSYYFSVTPHIWGWASWRRAWAKYDLQMQGWPACIGQIKAHASLPERIWAKYKSYFDLTRANQIDTWDYQWVYSIWKNQGLVISPKINLISNIGFGNDATHTVDPESIFSRMKTGSLPFPLIRPADIKRDRASESKSYDLVYPPLSKRIVPAVKRRLKRLLSFGASFF